MDARACLLAISMLAACGRPAPAPVGAAPPAVSSGLAGDSLRAEDLGRRGARLSPSEVQALEQRLARDPTELETRLLLIGYHGRRTGESRPSSGRHEVLVLGLIEHHPRSLLATHYELTSAGFHKGAALYRALAAAHPSDAAILGNAGCYLLGGVLDLEGTKLEGVRLLERAERLDRSEPRWPWMLGFAANVDAQSANPVESRNAAARGLDRLQRALDLARPSPPEWMRPQQLWVAEQMAELAWLAGDLPKAREQARRTLDLARSWSVVWQRANAIHTAETILGYAALAEGRIEQASSHLLASARVLGSPQLGSFGPDLGLALELLERGRVDAMLSYLDLCARFWNPGPGVLEDWKRSLRAGRRVDFAGLFHIARRRALGAASQQ